MTLILGNIWIQILERSTVKLLDALNLLLAKAEIAQITKLASPNPQGYDVY